MAISFWAVSVLIVSVSQDPAVHLSFPTYRFSLLRLGSFQSPHQERGVGARGPRSGVAVRDAHFLGR